MMINPREQDEEDRKFQRYRRSIVETWPESAHRQAVLAGIDARLAVLNGGMNG